MTPAVDGNGPSRGTAPPAPGSNLPEFTVAEISGAIKRTVEDAFGFVRVRGEISQPKYHGSGHLYLTLKDERAVLAAVCWRGTVGRLNLRAEDGMEVICTGRITTFAGQSKYQLVVESMELAGEGALLKLLEERRKRLAAEGVFDAARKRPLPFLPTVIGVVTSPTGAVIRDILHRLRDRFPCRVLVWPVAVQGDGAAAQIVEALAGFGALPAAGAVPRPDVLIVARGGGSVEDLMPFNDEAVVRAVVACPIPVISAVGHETDITLIDHAADRRAPTPTAAAEIAVPVRDELLATVQGLGARLTGGWSRTAETKRLRLDGLGRALGDPARLLEGAAQRLDDRAERLRNAAGAAVAASRARLTAAAAGLPHPRRAVAEAERALTGVAARLAAAPASHQRWHAGRLATLTQRLDDGAIRLAALPQRQRTTLMDTAGRLQAAVARTLEARAERVSGLGQLLESYSHRSVLRRGYALVRSAAENDQGRPLTAAAATKPGLPVTLEFGDGTAAAVIDGTGDRGDRDGAKRRTGEQPAARAPQAARPSAQGRLF